MVPSTKDAERKRAWSTAKTAVHAYAKDPSRDNADLVDAAWQTVRRVDSVSLWRQARTKWLGLDQSRTSSDTNGQKKP